MIVYVESTSGDTRIGETCQGGRILSGRDGRDGRDGREGIGGEKGDAGLPGMNCSTEQQARQNNDTTTAHLEQPMFVGERTPVQMYQELNWCILA